MRGGHREESSQSGACEFSSGCGVVDSVRLHGIIQLLSGGQIVGAGVELGKPGGRKWEEPS